MLTIQELKDQFESKFGTTFNISGRTELYLRYQVRHGDHVELVKSLRPISRSHSIFTMLESEGFSEGTIETVRDELTFLEPDATEEEYKVLLNWTANEIMALYRLIALIIKHGVEGKSKASPKWADSFGRSFLEGFFMFLYHPHQMPIQPLAKPVWKKGKKDRLRKLREAGVR